MKGLVQNLLFKNLIRHLKLIFKNLFFDANEVLFLKYCNEKKFIKKKKVKNYILIQTVTDYYYLVYYKTLISQNKFLDYEIIGLWPYFQRTVRKRFFFLEFLNEIYLYILDYIIFLKWKKLYKSIGITHIKRLNLSIFDRINFYTKSINLDFFFKKKNFFDFEINNIKIGDLLYDTYLRFRAQPTFFRKDKLFINKLIFKSNIVILKLEKLYKKYKFETFYTSYSSYIQHGLPVRFFLKKKINVFSGINNSQYNKKLSNVDVSHTESYFKFKNISQNIRNNETFLSISENDLKLRFSDAEKKKNKMSYLSVNTYTSKDDEKFDVRLLNNLDGILFLQDFYDSPHDWGNLVFDDFYKWTVYTLNIIKKYNLRIAVKPHPNSWYISPDSVLVYERLKKKFPGIIWLDKDYPNKIIFKKIKFGISCTGSVLFELAYHGIKAISCGEHPGIDFNFTINAKSKSHYKSILLDISNMGLPEFSKNDLLIYNYLYRHMNMDAYDNLARKIELKNIDFSKSNSLTKYIEKISKYKNDFKN